MSGRWNSVVSRALLAAGVVLLAAALVTYVWPAYEGQRLRAGLRAETPPVTPAQLFAGAASEATRGDWLQPSPGPVGEAVTLLTPMAETRPARPTQEFATPTSAVTATPLVTRAARVSNAPLPAPTYTSTTSPTGAPTPTLPVRLVIPDLGIDTAVVEMGWEVIETANGPRSEWKIPEYAAGHHINSAPLGAEGDVVISGHNNIYGRVFAPISLAWDEQNKQRVDNFTDRSDILNGRFIQVYGSDGRRFDYTVTAFYRVRDKGVPAEQRVANARFIQPAQETRLTLVTCWPITSNAYRLILVAKSID